MKKIRYRCKCCGWTKELPEEWGDIKPKCCMSSLCEYSVKKSRGRKSFRTNPEMLEISIIDLTPKKEPQVEKPTKRKKQK